MKRLYIPLLCMACLGVSCSRKVSSEGASAQEPQQIQLTGRNTSMMPKATVFRMSGDYADHVAVTLNPNGSLAYFPAPTDLTANSKPYDLGDGWYLNRQGLGTNSVFTKWTFEEYRSLPSVPSQQEILNAIIPGAKVIAMSKL